jgi:hemerythrin-like domain-containing protein
MTVDRRSALVLVGTAGLAGAALPVRGAEGEENVTANEDLMREHGVLRRILIIYREVAPNIERAGATMDAQAVNAMAKLFRTFGEQYHEKQLEEQFVFPAVRKSGGPLAHLTEILVAQHNRGREITDFVIGATKSGKIGTGDAASLARSMLEFARMYEAHAAREDTQIFPAFKKALPKAQFNELSERFEEIERKQFGGDGFDMALDQVAKAEATLHLSDLAQFTAPAPPK